MRAFARGPAIARYLHELAHDSRIRLIQPDPIVL
jgi:hypothetical protein